MLDFSPSPTGAAFQASDAYIKLICGPVGGGKSTVALYDLWLRAFRQKPTNKIRRTRFIILRNTMGQLKSTVKPLIDQWFVTPFGGKAGEWKAETFTLRIGLSDGTTVLSEFVMLAADTPDDVRRLLSLECSSAWVEEAREIDPDVFVGLVGRVNRFPNKASGGVTFPGVICSTNPPPMDTFWHDKMTNPPKNWGIFMQPPAVDSDGAISPLAENLKWLNPGYYENLIEGNTEAWVDVYLKNKFGSGGFGQPVFKGTFKREFHCSTEALVPVYTGTHKVIVGSDNGLTAAAIIGQQDARGRVNILGEAYVPQGETMGYERFLDTILIPKLTDLNIPRKDVLFVVDPACFTRAEANEVTIAMVIKQRGFAVQKAHTNSPEMRIGACEGLLQKQIDGGPYLRLSSTAPHLAAALDWGYRYRKATLAGGEPTIDKNFFSHCFVAGTPIDTPSGRVGIEMLKVGDLVDTPNGVQSVTATMSRLTHDLIKLEFDNGEIVVCTPDHPFFVGGRKVRADTIKYTDLLFSKGDNQWQKQSTLSKSSEELSSTGNPRAISKPAIRSMVCSTCTDLFGSPLLGKSLRGMLSTISTRTRRITGLKIWPFYTPAITQESTQRSVGKTQATAPKHYSTWRASTTAQRLGTLPLRVLPGIAKMPKHLGLDGNRKKLNAPTVPGRTLGSRPWPGQGIAHSLVQAWRAKRQVLMTSRAPATSAQVTSEPTSTVKQLHAARLVRRSICSNPEQIARRVYDLTVENEHCFFAGGILVSNCGDAFNYFALYFNTGATQGSWASKRREVQPATYQYA